MPGGICVTLDEAKETDMQARMTQPALMIPTLSKIPQE
jgi:hypothetical protein